MTRGNWHPANWINLICIMQLGKSAYTHDLYKYMHRMQLIQAKIRREMSFFMH